MPKYEVPAPNGKTYAVDMPTGASEDAIKAAAYELYQKDEQRRMMEEYGPGAGELFTRGIKRGFKQMGSALGDVVPAMVGSAFGAEDYAKRQMQEAADTQAEIQRDMPAAYDSYKQVHGLTSGLRYGAETLGEQIPNILTSLIPGVGAEAIAGKMAASTAGKALLAQAAERGLAGEAAEQFAQQGLKAMAPELLAKQQMAQNVGVYLGAYAQNTPETFQNIYEQTGKLEPSVAILFGAAKSALDSVLPARLASSITGPMKIGIAEKILEKSGMNRGVLRKVTSEALTDTVGEGLTEGAQEAIDMAAEHFVDSNKGLFNSEGWDRIMESAVKGAVAGGAFGGVGGVTEGVREGSERKERLNAIKEQRAARDIENERIRAYGGQMGLPGFDTRAPEPPAPAAPAEPPVPPSGIAPATDADNAKQLNMFGERESWQQEPKLAPGGAKVDRENAKFIGEAAKKLSAEAVEKGLTGQDAIKYVQDNLAAESERQIAEAQKAAEEKAKAAAPKSYEDIVGAAVNKATETAKAAAAKEAARVQAEAEKAAKQAERDRIKAEKEAAKLKTAADKAAAKQEVERLRAAEKQAKIDANKARQDAQQKATAAEEEAKAGRFQNLMGEAAGSTSETGEAPTGRFQNLMGEAASGTPETQEAPAGRFQNLMGEAAGSTSETGEAPTGRFQQVLQDTLSQPSGAGESAASPTAITDDLLASLGISPSASIRRDKPFEGFDISNPKDAQNVKHALSAHAKTVGKAARAKIEAFLARPEFAVTEPKAKPKRGKKAAAPAAPATPVTWSTPGAETPSIPGQGGVPATTMKVERAEPTPAERTAVLNEGWRQAAQENQTETTQRPAPAASSRAVDAVRRGNMGEAVGHLENEAGGNQKAGPTGVLSTLRELAGALRNMFSVTDDRSALIAADKKRVETDLGRDFTPEEELAHAKSIREAEDVYKKLQYMTSDKEGREKPNAVGRLLYKTNEAGTAFERDENGKKIPIYKQTTDKLVTAKRGFSNAKVVVEGNKGSKKDIDRLRQEGKTAEYDPSTNTFYFTSAGLNDETILRVMTHAATARVLWQYNHSPESLTPAQRSAAEHVTNIYNGVKRLNGDRNALQLKNVYSFVSYAMTNKPFQEYLGQLRSSEFPNIPFRMKLSNAWDTLLLAVARMIGVDKFAGLQKPLSTRVKAAQNMDNALLQVVDTLKDLLGSPNAELGINAKEAEVTSPVNPPRKKLGSAKLNAPVYKGKTLSAEGQELVKSGDVGKVLDHLIANASPIVATVLRKIKGLGLNVKLQVGASEEEGSSGSYDPKSNTVTIDPETGLNEHTLIHELVHAAISHVLYKPNHPLTKEFTKFFTQIQGLMGNVYGALNLQEFAAELVANPEFQAILKGIKAPKSENLFTRFIRSIAEFFGFSRSSFDEGMKFLNNAIDISGDVEPSDGAKLFLGINAMRTLGTIPTSAPSFTREAVETTKNAFSNLKGGMLQKAVLGMVSLDHLNKMYGRTLTGIQPLIDAIEKRTGMQDAMLTATKRAERQFTKVRKKDERTFAKMAKIAIDARLAQVDILNPNFNPTAANQAEYNRLKREFATLPREVQDVYEKMRKDFDKEFLAYKNFLLQQVRGNPSLTNKINTQFQARTMVVGYVPFKRYGDYWIEFPDPRTGERTAMAFESVAEREEFAKTLGSSVPANSIKMHKNIQDISYDASSVPPTTFVGEILAGLSKQGASQAMLNEVYQSYLLMFPGQSIVKQMTKSKDVAGMSQDLIRGYYSVMSSWASKFAGSTHIPAILESLDKINEEGRVSSDVGTAAAASNILAQRNFFLNPTNGNLVKTMTGASYFEFIAGNISSAIVNLTSLPMLVLPILGGTHGFGNATRAGMSAMTVAVNDWSNHPKYGPLFKAMSDHGQLQHTTTRDILGASDNLFAKAMDFISIPFSASERYNRAVTAIAAYELATTGSGVNGVRMSPQQAIKYALDVTKDAHTSGIAATSARWTQQGVGRVFFTFKRYTWGNAYVIARAFHQMMKGQSASTRNAARKQLLGTYGMAMAFAGAKGLPFMGAIGTMSTMLASLFGDDDEPFDFDQYCREMMGTLAYKGVFNELTNLEWSNRTGLANDLIFRDDPRGVSTNGYALSAMQQALGPMGTYLVNVERARQQFLDGHTERAIEGIMPSWARNGFKGYRYLTEGALTLKGDPVDTDINAWNALMQGIGFAPADLSLTYEELESAKGYEREKLLKRTKILNLYEMADMSGDTELMDKVTDMRLKYNETVPRKLKVLPDTLQKSAKARRAAENDMIHGVRFNKNLKPVIGEEFFPEE